jgi:3-hydroxyisobutyrate dehydrogenase-like beta-hydroxyacid dehydrogenase
MSAPAEDPSARPVSASPAVGIVGLGLVGRALAGRIVAAGHTVLGFDHAPAARAAWQSLGHGLEASPAALARRCTTVLVAVFDTTGVLQVVEGDDGLVHGSALQLVVDCSTGDPDVLMALATRLAARGIDFIEAPLSGSSEQIAAGEATLLLGAEAAVLGRHERLLASLAAQRVHAGGPGMGARAKLATNLVLGLNRAALAEGMVFAERLGIAPDRFLALVLGTPARSDAALVKGRRMVQGDFEPPQSRIRQHLKDVELMLVQAAQAGQRLPLSQAHAELMRAAVAAGDGELDNAAIVRQLRREAREAG